MYIVSYAGVTGSKNVDINNVKKLAKMIRNQSKIPIGVGFGIKNYNDVKTGDQIECYKLVESK